MSHSITIKDIDDEILNRLNVEAQKRGVSLNMLALQLISEAIGLGHKTDQYKHDDELTNSWVRHVEINRLINYSLNQNIEVVIEPDDDGFIARNTDPPLYGFGDSPEEALDALKYEIESLYHDLNQDDNFTSDWFKIRRLLGKIIIKNEKQQISHQ